MLPKWVLQLFVGPADEIHSSAILFRTLGQMLMSSQFEFIDPNNIRREFFGEPKQTEPPPLPLTVNAIGLNSKFLSNQVLKTMYILDMETSPEIAGHLKLPQSLVDKLLAAIKQQGHLEVLGSVPSNIPILRYGLTPTGREMATDAFRQCEYVGPVPVTLADYKAQIAKQSISEEWVGSQDIGSRTCSSSHK